MRAGAVVLAGGRSSRMGRPKALLDWHGQTAVEHAVAVVRAGVDGGPVCVVRAPGQELPALDAIVVEDAVAYAGPLAALARGPRGARRAAARSRSPAASTRRCSCLRSCGRSCASLRDGDDAVVPVIGGRSQPLLAAYRVALVPRLRELLAQRPRRPAGHPRRLRGAGCSRSRSCSPDADLAAADPRLRSALEREHARGVGCARDAGTRPARPARRPGACGCRPKLGTRRRLHLAALDEQAARRRRAQP